jgi:hypothetical protein
MQKQNQAEAILAASDLYGQQNIDEFTEIIEDGLVRKLYKGADTYKHILLFNLKQVGVQGLEGYHPKNMKILQPLGKFVMEVEKDDFYDRPHFYAVLTTTGQHAGTLTDTFTARNWRHAMEILAEEANSGLINSKYVEIKPQRAQHLQAMAQSMSGVI